MMETAVRSKEHLVTNLTRNWDYLALLSCLALQGSPRTARGGRRPFSWPTSLLYYKCGSLRSAVLPSYSFSFLESESSSTRIHATKGFLQIGSVDTTVNWINTPLEIQGPDVLFWLWGFEFITHLPPLLLYKNPFNSCQSNFYCKNRTENFVTDSMENYILIWTIHFPIPAALSSPLDNESDILLLAYFISKPFNTEIIFLARDGS